MEPSLTGHRAERFSMLTTPIEFIRRIMLNGEIQILLVNWTFFQDETSVFYTSAVLTVHAHSKNVPYSTFVVSENSHN